MEGTVNPHGDFNPFACREATQKQIAELEKRLQRFEQILVGVDGDNGVRGTLKKLADSHEELTREFTAFAQAKAIEDAGRKGKWDTAGLLAKAIWLTVGTILLGGFTTLFQNFLEKLAQ